MSSPRDFDLALEDLAKLRGPSDDSEWRMLEGLLVGAAQRAARWDEHADPYEDDRARDRDFIESGLPSMQATVAKLQGLAERHTGRFDAAVFRAIRSIGLTPDILRSAGYSYDDDGWLAGPFLRKLLAALHDHLEIEADPGSRQTVKGRRTGGRHRVIWGPLQWPHFVDETRMPDGRRTGLQFELAFHLRRYTGGLRMREIMIDDTLPTVGRPHHAIAAQFVFAAIGVFIDDNGDAFQKVMSNHSGVNGEPVRWWGWGAPEGYDRDTKSFAFFAPDD
ncbi:MULTISPECIES: hypothetical protein [unclassified Mesorhizobium]|uniref:hypothetical protein n=1 Tax=unclassified Mesorhizobium TaxID=325217 RepID=UPI00333BFDD7